MKTTITSAESEKDSNSSIIKNLGTIILGSVALVLAMILTAILIKFSRIPLIMKITAALKNKLFFNSILRTGVQSYL
jgi:multisubunit Na+/H+ antiporter MnhC subunit